MIFARCHIDCSPTSGYCHHVVLTNNGVYRKEYTKLFDFLKSKKIRIQNTGAEDDADDFGGNSGSDNEMPDHYLEKMKAEGERETER